MRKKNILLKEEQLGDLLNNLFSGIFSPTINKETGVSTDETDSVYQDKGFTYLNLNTKDGYNAYKEIADKFINSRNQSAGITGDMIASSAKKFFSRGYVPPELALSQLALEGGLSTNPNAKPRRTKNPYNVGNIDTGQVVKHGSIQSGIDAYFDLMTRRYLNVKKADELVNNFVNDKGQRYASATKYESDLKSIISGINKLSEPVIAKLKSKETDIS